MLEAHVKIGPILKFQVFENLVNNYQLKKKFHQRAQHFIGAE